MKVRDALAVMALAVTFVAIAAAASWLRADRRGAAPGGVPLPQAGLALAIASAHLGQALEAGVSPFWDAAVRPAALARPGNDQDPGAVGIYRHGWVVVSASPIEHAGAVSERHGSWYVTASAAGVQPAADASRVLMPLPDDGVALLWKRTAAAWEGAFPTHANGVVDPRTHRESWTLSCDHPCLLDTLRADAEAGSPSAIWSALPAESSAVVEMVFDPDRLEPALENAMVVSVERFLGFPLRRELARALAGRGAAALIEPTDSTRESILAVFDLARPDLARSLVERMLALGVLSGEVGIERYRDVTVGAWTRRGGAHDLHPAIAVDGDVLLFASRKTELLAAIDRRRRSSPTGPARSLLDAAGSGSWRAWSRSSFLTNAWFELLTGRRAKPELAAGAVSARLTRRDGKWVLESSGEGPAFAADPLLPVVRSLVRAARVTR